MAKPTAREYHTQQVHYLRKTVNFNDVGIATGVYMGTLPAGAQIVDIVVNVVTAFNAVSSNVLTVGTNSTSFDDIVAAANVDESSATGQRVTTGLGLELAADADVYAKYTQSGTAANAGQAVIVIAYVPNNDR